MHRDPGSLPSTGQALPAHVRAKLEAARIAVVVPCYRVEQQIRSVIQGIPEYVTYIVAVDDASPDNSGIILDEVAKELPDKLHIVRHGTNRGVGGAVTSGYLEAARLGARVVVKVDGDGQMDPTLLPYFVWPIVQKRAEYVKGNRFSRFADSAAMPKVRRVGNSALTFLVRVASGYWNISDPTNGYTAISVETLRTLDIAKLEQRYLFESSLLAHLYLLRARVAQVPMKARYGDEKSSLNIPKVSFQLSWAMVKWWFKRILWTYFWSEFTLVSVFLLFGSLLVGLGSGFGLYHWIRSSISNQPATAGTVMLAALPLILGFELLLNALVLDTQNMPTKPPAFLDQSFLEELE